MSTDLAVIEAALKAATPGPWRADNNDVWTADGDRFISAPVRIADANLIANAPTWLAELVERVKVAEAEVKRVREAAHTLGKIIDNQCRDVLDITGAHDLIDADGDGDWGVIWDLLREQAQKGQRAEAAEAAIERVRALADRLKAGGFTSVYESAQELGEMIADALDGDA